MCRPIHTLLFLVFSGEKYPDKAATENNDWQLNDLNSQFGYISTHRPTTNTAKSPFVVHAYILVGRIAMTRLLSRAERCADNEKIRSTSCSRRLKLCESIASNLTRKVRKSRGKTVLRLVIVRVLLTYLVRQRNFEEIFNWSVGPKRSANPTFNCVLEILLLTYLVWQFQFAKRNSSTVLITSKTQKHAKTKMHNISAYY